MNTHPAALGALAVLAAVSTTARAGGDELPVPAAMASLSQQVGITTVRIEYARPSLKGRALLSTAAPAGRIWAPGEAAVPHITFSRDVVFLDAAIPAGTYALLVVPGPADWIVVLNRDLELASAARHRPDLDVLRARARVHAGPHQEQLEFSFRDFTDDGGLLQLAWGGLRVDFPVRVHTLQQIAEAIAALDDAWRWYADAAEYLWKVRHDTTAGLRYIDQSIALHPTTRNAAIRASLLAVDQVHAPHIAPAVAEVRRPERAVAAREETAARGPAAPEIGAVVDRGRAELQSCYQRALRQDPSLTRARVDVDIDVGTSGMVKAIRLAPAHPPAALEACIRGSVARWVFPPSDVAYQANLPLVVRGRE